MDGILLINKPKGYSSHDCIAVLRGMLKTRKLGHTGTLDPDATGLLVVGVNNGTKIMRYLNQDNKVYEATLYVGASTTTLDHSGDVIAKTPVSKLTNIDDVIASFNGDIIQQPPMYSAIKYKGKRLYEYARQGIDIPDRPLRRIHITSIKRTSDVEYIDDHAMFSYTVKGSKGLYVRTLSYDIAKQLGYPGHNLYLNRLEAGLFNVTDAYTLEDVQAGKYTLISLSDALQHLPVIVADKDVTEALKYGRLLPMSYFDDITETRIVDANNTLLAIYAKHPTKNMMKPMNVFYKD
jgi:tRNA pseudouridine55 synthase